MNETLIGMVLLVLAGAMNGSFTVPMKFTKKWNWENTWLAWTIYALILFPPILVSLTLPHLQQVYAATGSRPVVQVALFGAGWGMAQVLFGLAVDSIGIALTFSIVLGLSAAVGSLVPLFELHSERAWTQGGMGIIAGVFIVLVGVTLCAIAGRKREAATHAAEHSVERSYGKGLASALLCGFGAAFVNLGLAYGQPLIVSARNFGAAPTWAPNAAWLPLMLAGAIPNLAYCIYLMRKNRSLNLYALQGTSFYWLLAALMAFFWFLSTQLYGIASERLGALGPVLGWPSFMSLIVITANIWSLTTGEWRNTGKQPLRFMLAGVATLVLAVFVIGLASRYI
ncbi:MAG: L-rhamnose/proton symporter RhaT [Candidatus Acidiferrales bacterium]